MSQIVIFCESYGQIKYALRLVELNCNDRSVTIVIPGFLDLFRFFQVINERVYHNTINLIDIEPYQARRVKAPGLTKIFHVIPDIIRERRYLRDAFVKNFADCAGCEVYFFSRGFNGFTFYLLKKLIKRNRLVYVSLASLGPPWSKYTPVNIAHLVKLIIGKLTYGREIILGQLPYYKGFLYMPNKFIDKKVDRVIDSAEIEEMMRGFDLSPFRVFDAADKCSVIYFDDDLVGTGYVSAANLYEKELTGILSILGKCFPQKEIAIKYHPGHSGEESLAGFGETLPQFIPAELLYNDNIKLYLAVMSWSIAHVESGLAVSLLGLITFKSDEIRNGLKEELIEVSQSKILFPKTLDEFEQILIDLKASTKL